MDRTNFTRLIGLSASLLALPGPAQAQFRLPGSVDAVGALRRVGDATRDIADRALEPVGSAVGGAADLARDRLSRLTRLVAESDGAIEWDDNHEPARAGEVLLLDPDAQSLTAVRDAGYAVIEQSTIDDLGIAYARLSIPHGQSLPRALKTLRAAAPGHEITADQIHFPSGAASAPALTKEPATPLLRGGTVGVIDGAIAGSDRVVMQRGFAVGAPKASNHASAIASLLKGAGTARLYSADVYGSDPAGGNALAIARAVGWLTGQGVRVVSISLVGPANPLLSRAVAAAQAKGTVIVAAVGNDGPAAPPAYPASYTNVIAVTGVDGRGRVLIEAGRATHLDYAAPGADITAKVPGKGQVKLRGTSYAAPLVASRIAARIGGGAVAALQGANGEARGASKRTGRGILCATCRAGT